VPESLQLRAGPDAESALLQVGTDYQVDADWGTLGWATQEVAQAERKAFASYSYGKARIDSIVMGAQGRITIREGTPHVTVPVPPALTAGETLLANVWLPVRLAKLTPDCLYPILESRYPESPLGADLLAAALIPKTYAKLTNGEPVTILAWGDSVTDGSFLPDPATGRWQEQFVARLRAKFPKAPITLITEAWGGRNTDSYRAEPPGSVHNYQEKVLAVKPDLVVSEFVNDGWLSDELTQTKYGVILEEFKGIGAEWIILTPHYILPEWMGGQRQRDIDEDPRAYVKGLRAFAATNHIALADASLRWGRLWRQGIPYMTLMLNAINHPDAAGMGIFADSLMDLF
jgi:lysophospholipase L1-like esterase